MYNVAEIARILDLHPKTVRRLIRDGQIKARKIGREWRIRKEDLREYAHGELTGPSPDPSSPIPLEDRIHVSAVIELEEGDSEEVSRITNTLLAVVSAKDREWGDSRYDVIFHPETRKARFVVHGSPGFIKALLEMVEVLAGSGDDR